MAGLMRIVAIAAVFLGWFLLVGMVWSINPSRWELGVVAGVVAALGLGAWAARRSRA